MFLPQMFAETKQWPVGDQSQTLPHKLALGREGEVWDEIS